MTVFLRGWVTLQISRVYAAEPGTHSSDLDRSAPVLCTMPNMQDFDNLTCDAVHDDVRRGDEFAGSF
jgi:hypothetical protein